MKQKHFNKTLHKIFKSAAKYSEDDHEAITMLSLSILLLAGDTGDHKYCLLDQAISILQKAKGDQGGKVTKLKH